MSNKVFFYIEPYVYSSFMDKDLLLYNTFNFEQLTFHFNDDLFLTFIRKLFEKNETRIIEFSGEFLQNKKIKTFVNKCRDYFMGDTVKSDKQPLIFTPVPKLNRDSRELNKQGKPSPFYNDLKYSVKNLNIFLNSSKSTKCQNRELLTSGYKQILFPHVSINNNIDSFHAIIKNFFVNYNLNNISVVNIYGNGINSSGLHEFTSIFKDKIVYNVYYGDFNIKDIEVLEIIKSKNVPIVFWVDDFLNKKIFSKLNSIGINCKYKFVIENEKQYYLAKKLLPELNCDYEFIPFYNKIKNNLEFFKANIYTTHIDIKNQKLNMRNIFSRMYLNHSFYGKLYLLPNGEIYNNLYSDSLGNIKSLNIEKILKDTWYNEHYDIWFKTRNSVEPCKRCIYKFICGPISNYELSIGKMNLCQYDISLRNWKE